ncbi:response regulator [Myxosarcina sp. GI1]|uniref:response regulator n=1 Tax=Myxosarcina sp. GI1 TaxID=1541065 RepID=UPI00056C16CE|nr:response regulator [Myxosarcina sp. GI1]
MAAKRVLLIDDNEDNRTLVKFALEMNTDWEVLLASDGVKGVTKAELERPDVILLDVIMPYLNGLEVYEVLKNNLFTCAIPLIFITATTQTKVIAKLENTLATGVIIKPFDPLRLDTQIAKICNWNLESIGKTVV